MPEHSSNSDIWENLSLGERGVSMRLAVAPTVWQKAQQCAIFQSFRLFLLLALCDAKRVTKTNSYCRISMYTVEGVCACQLAGDPQPVAQLLCSEFRRHKHGITRHWMVPWPWPGEPALRLAFVDLAGSERLPAEAWHGPAQRAARAAQCAA